MILALFKNFTGFLFETLDAVVNYVSPSNGRYPVRHFFVTNFVCSGRNLVRSRSVLDFEEFS